MKPFKSIEEQIDILKSRGLLFEDENASKVVLMYYGYYEIVNGYQQFLCQTKNVFNENETFEHLYAIYRLDHDLQNVILQSTLEVETLLKTALSYCIAKTYGHDQKYYLARDNYKSGKRIFNSQGDPIKKDGRDLYEIDTALRKFEKIIEDNIQPFKHYREDHGHIPPWILFKGCSFGNIRHFYKLQRPPIKDEVISIMMSRPKEIPLTNEEAKTIFADIIFVAQKFRNRAAHSGRIIDFKADGQNIRYGMDLGKILNTSKEEFERGYGKGDFYSLFGYLRLLKDTRPVLLLAENSRNALLNHFNRYPRDEELIYDSLGVPPRVRKTWLDDIMTTNRDNMAKD